MQMQLLQNEIAATSCLMLTKYHLLLPSIILLNPFSAQTPVCGNVIYINSDLVPQHYGLISTAIQIHLNLTREENTLLYHKEVFMYANNEDDANYGFGIGSVIRAGPQVVIKLDDGPEVVPKKHCVIKFQPKANDRVIVSWRNRRSFRYPEMYDGVHYVDPGAIEPTSLWQRQSLYRSNYRQDRAQLSFRTETDTINILRHKGLRAERATAFEDEKLGIDLWIFLQINEVWRWYPVDITLWEEGKVNGGKKFTDGYSKGVVTVRIKPGDTYRPYTLYNRFMNNFMQGYEAFLLNRSDFISRSRAKKWRRNITNTSRRCNQAPRHDEGPFICHHRPLHICKVSYTNSHKSKQLLQSNPIQFKINLGAKTSTNNSQVGICITRHIIGHIASTV